MAVTSGPPGGPQIFNTSGPPVSRDSREKEAALKFRILAVHQDGKLTENLNLGFITLRLKTFSIGMRKFTGVLRYLLAWCRMEPCF